MCTTCAHYWFVPLACPSEKVVLNIVSLLLFRRKKKILWLAVNHNFLGYPHLAQMVVLDTLYACVMCGFFKQLWWRTVKQTLRCMLCKEARMMFMSCTEASFLHCQLYSMGWPGFLPTWQRTTRACFTGHSHVMRQNLSPKPLKAAFLIDAKYNSWWAIMVMYSELTASAVR